jgi:hypothetical protein
VSRRYAVYDPPYTAPSRALLLNTLVYPAPSVPRNTSASALPARPTTRVALAGLQGAMEVRRLAIARASDTGNVTWAGVSYATPDGAPFGDEVVLRTDVADGVDVAGAYGRCGVRLHALKWVDSDGGGDAHVPRDVWLSAARHGR